jgi:tetratricopeptide (TPR) repeat protein
LGDIKSENTNDLNGTEARDCEKVDKAIECLMKKDLDTAFRLLSGVIENTPADYVNEFSEGDCYTIKFWDQSSFLYYIEWYKKNLKHKELIWVRNVYPRAYFYLGFIMMESEDWERAIEFFKKGRSLEPTNPKFNHEMAYAYSRLGDHQKALELFRSAQIVNAYSSKYDNAAALRGEGFVLIEMGDLDGAEKAYQRSLYIGHNRHARRQLKYIKHLRSGGKRVQANIFQSDISKQWWQFWK